MEQKDANTQRQKRQRNEESGSGSERARAKKRVKKKELMAHAKENYVVLHKLSYEFKLYVVRNWTQATRVNIWVWQKPN